MIKSTIRRSACDHCRSRRVQCLRPQNTIAPCARCAHIGARCVTSATGNPGRPRKQRLVNNENGPPGRLRTSPSSSTTQEVNRVEVYATAESVAEQPERACRIEGRPSLGERLLDGDGCAESDLAASKSPTTMLHPPKNPLADDGSPQVAANFWSVTSVDGCGYYDSSSINQNDST